MKKFLALFSLFLLVLTPALAENYQLDVTGSKWAIMVSENEKSISLIPGVRYVFDVEDPSQYKWSSSNNDIVTIWSNGSFVSSGSGKVTLTGKPLNNEAPTIKTSVSISIPYVSSKDIVVDSPDGSMLITYFGNGIITTNYSGDRCFDLEEIDDDDPDYFFYYPSTASKILPLKEGKGSIIYEINFKKKIIVNVTVKKSALMTEEEYQDYLDSKADTQTAIVKKTANIRADASSESQKVGSVKSGDELIITQPFYNSKWHQILYNGELCYIAASYVNIQTE